MREWLKQIRHQQSLTQAQVAQKIGISREYYTRIENGSRRCPPQTAKTIANVLGFDWTKFYEAV
jgi:transcriptional regulator with XRE-family HTH domain